MRIRRAADFPAPAREGEPRARADFLADKFEDERKKRGVNPEHPRLEGYVAVDGKVPKLVIQTKRINGALGQFQRFNRYQIPEAVDFALLCIEWLVDEDQCEEEVVKVEKKFKESFDVQRMPGSASLKIRPKAGNRSRMSAELYWFRCGPENEKTNRMENLCANLKLDASLPLEDALALCEGALDNAEKL